MLNLNSSGRLRDNGITGTKHAREINKCQECFRKDLKNFTQQKLGLKDPEQCK